MGQELERVLCLQVLVFRCLLLSAADQELLTSCFVTVKST